jgi:hypothetical protein
MNNTLSPLRVCQLISQKSPAPDTIRLSSVECNGLTTVENKDEKQM